VESRIHKIKTGRNPKSQMSRKFKNFKMNKKIIYYGLIASGVFDFLIWIINGFYFGWLELIVGVNVISKWGAWLMIASGIWLLKKENAKEKSEIDAITDLEPGEEIIFKNTGNATIITITNKKLICRAYNVQDETLKNFDNVVQEEKVIFYYHEIEDVIPVKAKDIANTKIGKLSSFEFGISLKLKNGVTVNLPSSKSELICAHISKLIKK